jgi:hypothetical protein
MPFHSHTCTFVVSVTCTKDHSHSMSCTLLHGRAWQAKMQAARAIGASHALANILPGKNVDGERVDWGKDTLLKNRVQLSTYPDCIGKDMDSLESFINTHLKDVVSGIHVLPFYPSSADRGFAPVTYEEVDPDFGDWGSIARMSKGRDFCADFMINHISAQSKEFKDFEEKGSQVCSCVLAPLHSLLCDSRRRLVQPLMYSGRIQSTCCPQGFLWL